MGGVRRYQNEDGTLTEAGKKRYTSSDYSRELNNLDKKNVDARYNVNKYTDIAEHYARKSKKAETKGRFDKQAKYEAKRNDALFKVDQYSKKVNDTVSETKRLVQKAFEAGYNVTVKECRRSPSTDRGKRIVANMGGILVSSALAFAGTPRVPIIIGGLRYDGNKYSVKRTIPYGDD